MNEMAMRSRTFDFAFIWAPLILALAIGFAAPLFERPISLIIAVTWVFGYGHATAMFSRLYFDEEMRKRHWFVAWVLPPVCLVSIAGLQFLNPVIVPSLFIISRFFHYIRQSHAFSRILGRQYASGVAHAILVYVLPTLLLVLYLLVLPKYPGLEWRSLDFDSRPLEGAAAALVFVAFAWLIVRLLRSRVSGEQKYLMYIFSHLAIFAIGYLCFRGFGIGILMLAAWHGAQYLLFVWHFNNRRWNGSRGTFASLFSDQKTWLSFIALATATATLYGGLYAIEGLLSVKILFVATMAINFHHYISEAVIWRR